MSLQFKSSRDGELRMCAFWRALEADQMSLFRLLHVKRERAHPRPTSAETQIAHALWTEHAVYNRRCDGPVAEPVNR